jgi:large subunit ribosomal protein L24
MKQKFSTSWKASKQPRKQRKYSANAPLHLKAKLLSVNLSKPLRKTVGKRNIQVRKDDKVKVMRGKFKGHQGKVTSVNIKYAKIYIDGIQTTKMDNSKANVPLKPSNLQIIEMTERKKKIKTEDKKPVSGTKSKDPSSKESRTKEVKNEVKEKSMEKKK